MKIKFLVANNDYYLEYNLGQNSEVESGRVEQSTEEKNSVQEKRVQHSTLQYNRAQEIRIVWCN